MTPIIFTDYEVVKEIGKRGKVKWAVKEVTRYDTLIPIELEFEGFKRTFYTRAAHSDREYKPLYHASGEYVIGVWKHGHLGTKRHEEGVYVCRGQIQIVTSYQGGRKKDQNKYLLGIR